MIRKVGAAVEDFRLPSSTELTSARPLRRLREPWLERRHLYRYYATFLGELVERGLRVVPLREFHGAGAEGAVLLGLRHDVDERLDSALELARLEHARGIRSTYFVLHTAGYYESPQLVSTLRELQGLGHEVGFHYDLVTLQIVLQHQPRAYLTRELGRLRDAGIDIVGAAGHGSYWGHKLGYKNEYFFRDLPAPQPGFPNVDEVGSVQLVKGTLAEFGFAYDASALGETHYWTDSWFDEQGRRWHPDRLDLGVLHPGDRAIVLVHPCHWDRSLSAKYARTLGRLARRVVGEGGARAPRRGGAP
jgi:hypothetical protein